MIPKTVLDEWDRLRGLYPQLLGWALQEDHRAYARHGITWCGRRTIGLSTWVWELNGSDNPHSLDTLRHEAAHAIAGYEAGHGPVWRRWAVRLGAQPITSRPHGGLKIYVYVATCSVCGQDHYTRSRSGLVTGRRTPVCSCAQRHFDQFVHRKVRNEGAIKSLKVALKPYMLRYSKNLQVVET
jgi:hypothetical protein